MKDTLKLSMDEHKVRPSTFLFNIVFSLCALPGFSMADTPITQYVSELPSQTSATLGSTSLGHTYLPIVGGTFSLNTTASRNISESFSYPKDSGGGGGSTGFSLTVINNQPSSPLYVFVQGSLTTTPWGTNACEVPANTTEEYIDTCVGGQGIPQPGNPNFTVYFSSSANFSSTTSYSSVTHFLSCPPNNAAGATYDSTNYTYTLNSSQAYQLTISSSGACSLSLA